MKRKGNAWVYICGFVCLLALFGTGVANYLRVTAEFGFPNILGEGLHLKIDPVSNVFAFSASLTWFLAHLFSIPYMRHEQIRQARQKESYKSGAGLFYVAFSLCFVFTLAVFYSKDLFTTFLFFKLLTLSSYLLVRHEGTSEAEDASTLYLFVGLVGGLLVLAGMIMLKGRTGSVAFEAVSRLEGTDLLWVAVSFILGFGVKAGIFGFHGWLPRAHPVAPSPASAVLSGVMIKVGVYGIFRTLISLRETEIQHFLPVVLAFIGLLNLWWGGIGALRALNLKKVLAFSSVSQIGYLLLALSQITREGHSPATVMAGTFLHVLNHGLFKPLLFLVSGLLLMDRGSVELIDLRGSLRSNRWASVGFATGFLGITAIPGFNGYISKTFIHDALLEAVSHSHAWWSFVERGFVLGSSLTVLYFLRLLIVLWILKPRVYDEIQSPKVMDDRKLVPLSFIAFLIVMLSIGVFPRFWLETLVVPALGVLNVSHETIGEILAFQYFSQKALRTVFYCFLWAFWTFIVFRKRLTDFSEKHDRALIPMLSSVCHRFCVSVGLWLNDAVRLIYILLTKMAGFLAGFGSYLERCIQMIYGSASLRIYLLLSLSKRFHKGADSLFTRSARAFGKPRLAHVSKAGVAANGKMQKRSGCLGPGRTKETTDMCEIANKQKVSLPCEVLRLWEVSMLLFVATIIVAFVTVAVLYLLK